MSHVATIKVEIKDLQALRDACAAKGWSFREGQKTYSWYGQWVGDTPATVEMFESQVEFEKFSAMAFDAKRAYMTAKLGKCDHAISIPGCQYEVGIQAKGDGTYGLVWDYFSAGGLDKALGGNGAPKLIQSYATHKMINEARRLGHALESQETLQDGTVRLRLLAAR